MDTHSLCSANVYIAHTAVCVRVLYTLCLQLYLLGIAAVSITTTTIAAAAALSSYA